MLNCEETCDTCLFAKGDFCRLFGTSLMSVACDRYMPVWTAPRVRSRDNVRNIEHYEPK